MSTPDKVEPGSAGRYAEQERKARSCDANARLIAAAPDLLHMLRRYVAYDHYINGDEAKTIERYRLACAAIDKATGAKREKQMNADERHTLDKYQQLADRYIETLTALTNLVIACQDVRPYQMGVVGPERDLPQILVAKHFLDTYEAALAVLAKARAA